MTFYLKGAKIPHYKNTSGMSAVKLPDVKKVVIPTAMHIGAPAKPIVKKGDTVKVGTLIAEQNGFVSSPVYASISGTVTAVEDILLSNGKTVPAITIESDGKMEKDENITPPTVRKKQDLLDALKQSGIVGLGGAGFPTYVKFATDKKIEYLVVNGAECEPFITSDSVTMVDSAKDILKAIDVLTKRFKIDKVIIGIEKNKPEAISKMREIAEKNDKISVKVLPSLYPQGGEKVLVYHTTGRVIPMGKLPIDVGCVVINSTTLATIGKYIKTGMPLVEKCITVDGGAVEKPQNVIAPIGTPVSELLNFCGMKSEPKKILYGGPMMGIAVPDIDAPVLKNTNAILALNEQQAEEPKTTACIKCGSCAHHCPFGIDPTRIAEAKKQQDIELLKKVGTELCMECGCCSFVCPAKRPIVQNNRLAKAMLREAAAKEAK